MSELFTSLRYTVQGMENPGSSSTQLEGVEATERPLVHSLRVREIYRLLQGTAQMCRK